MSMSTHVIGFRPPDATWKKHKKVWDACAEAGIDPPEETSKFFNDEPPDDNGVEVELEDTPAVTEWQDEGREGYEIDVSKLPKGLSIVRFYNAY